jgi:hypothetical protein
MPRLAGRLDRDLQITAINVHPWPESNGTPAVASDEGSSPHRTATAQSRLSLPHNIEFDLAYRLSAACRPQKGHSCQTIDLHTSWSPIKSVLLTVATSSFLQPRHHEFAGDIGVSVGMRRNLDAGVTWTR